MREALSVHGVLSSFVPRRKERNNCDGPGRSKRGERASFLVHNAAGTCCLLSRSSVRGPQNRNALHRSGGLDDTRSEAGIDRVSTTPKVRGNRSQPCRVQSLNT
jgi:hypothetical protein